MKPNILPTVLLLAFVAMVACSDVGRNDDIDFTISCDAMEFSGNTLSFESGSQTIMIEIITGENAGKWNARCPIEDVWCTLSILAGQLVVSVTQNNTNAVRSSWIQLSLGDHVKRIDLTQDYVRLLSFPAGDFVSVGAEDHIESIALTTNILPQSLSASVIDPPDCNWITGIGIETASIVFSILGNPSAESTRSATIRVWGDGKTAQITVVQSPGGVFSVWPDQLWFPVDGTTERVRVRSTRAWQLVKPVDFPEWISVSPETGFDETSVEITLAPIIPGSAPPLRNYVLLLRDTNGDVIRFSVQQSNPFDPVLNSVSDFLNLRNMSTYSRYNLTLMSPRIDALRTNLMGRYPLEYFFMRSPWGTGYQYGITAAFENNGAFYYQLRFTTGLVPLTEPDCNPLTDASITGAMSVVTSGLPFVGEWAADADFLSLLNFFLMPTGFTIIQEGDAFWFVSRADSNDWFLCQAVR